MSAPICPRCRGTAVSPDPLSAGHNVCACGHRAPVRDFHEAAELNDLAVLRTRPFPKKGLVIPETTPPPPQTYRAASKPEPRHPQHAPKVHPVEEHFWWQDT